jgi:carboxyl-terminal processing protease
MSQKRPVPKPITLFSVLLLMLVLVFTGVGFAAQSPQALYDEVWKLVNTKYVDSDKNGQDWGIWRHRYDDKLKTMDDAYVAIETMLNSLNDRYTRFLTPEEFADEGNSIRATLFGIGIQIGVRNDQIVVISPIEDTPAEKAGLKAQDIIVEINGESTKGMSVKEAADRIRGEKGTNVDLLVKRGDKQPKLYTVTRDEIKLKSVSTSPPVPVKDNIGYIRLSSFLSKKASAEMKDALREQTNKDGYIIDLRSNPGGLLTNAITIADFFLDHGGIVSTVDRDGYKDTKNASRGILTDKPIVVIINEGSASASEILSGALRDNNRAILVGKKTFGKGLVQEINSLPNGSGVNITTQKYLTPNDTDINKVGIVPDIEVEMPEVKDDEIYDPKKQGDPQLMEAQAVLQDLIAGKSLKHLQARNLTKASSESTPALMKGRERFLR